MSIGAIDRVLLVTDYVPVIGGIERIVQMTASLLEQQGVDVAIWGWSLPTNRRERPVRVGGVLLSHANVFAAGGLDRAIARHQPDLVWLHSVSRWIGPSGLRALRNYDGHVRKTYHDFGYVHPFASEVYQLDALPSFSERGFVAAAGSSRYRRLYARIKYRKMAAIRHHLVQHCTRHIVPSPFLVDVMRTSWGLRDVDVLPHCVMEVS